MNCRIKNGKKDLFGGDCHDWFDDHLLKILGISGGGHKASLEWRGGIEAGWKKCGMEPYTSSAIGICSRCGETFEMFSQLPQDLYKIQLETKYGLAAMPTQDKT